MRIFRSSRDLLVVKKKTKAAPNPRLRNWQCGEVYHVYQRGNYKQDVFHTDVQLITYLQRLNLLAERYFVRIHAFCLMSNHVHVLVETSRKDGISRFMQHLQAYHSRWIHGTKGLDGHLWKNRFGAKRIKSPRHYRDALLYIERNLLAAGLVRYAQDYPYSSAAARVANRSTAVIGYGMNQAIVQLYVDRWQRECDPSAWKHWLCNPKSAALDEDLAEVRKVLGKDRKSPLNPGPLPFPGPPQAAQAATAYPGCE